MRRVRELNAVVGVDWIISESSFPLKSLQSTGEHHDFFSSNRHHYKESLLRDQANCCTLNTHSSEISSGIQMQQDTEFAQIMTQEVC